MKTKGQKMIEKMDKLQREKEHAERVRCLQWSAWVLYSSSFTATCFCPQKLWHGHRKVHVLCNLGFVKYFMFNLRYESLVKRQERALQLRGQIDHIDQQLNTMRLGRDERKSQAGSAQKGVRLFTTFQVCYDYVRILPVGWRRNRCENTEDGKGQQHSFTFADILCRT